MRLSFEQEARMTYGLAFDKVIETELSYFDDSLVKVMKVW